MRFFYVPVTVAVLVIVCDLCFFVDISGCGFIGRNLVEYLVVNDLVSGVRVVDKTPPQLAFLNPAHTKVFEDPRVEYKSANLINPGT